MFSSSVGSVSNRFAAAGVVALDIVVHGPRRLHRCTVKGQNGTALRERRTTAHVACEEQPHEALRQRLPALDSRRQLCL